jgi:hypothetical protein
MCYSGYWHFWWKTWENFKEIKMYTIQAEEFLGETAYFPFSTILCLHACAHARACSVYSTVYIFNLKLGCLHPVALDGNPLNPNQSTFVAT